MRILDVDLKKALEQMSEKEKNDFMKKVDDKILSHYAIIKSTPYQINYNTQELQEIFKSMGKPELAEIIRDGLDLRYIPEEAIEELCNHEISDLTKEKLNEVVSGMPMDKISLAKSRIIDKRNSKYRYAGYNDWDIIGKELKELGINGLYEVPVVDIYTALEEREKQLEEQENAKNAKSKENGDKKKEGFSAKFKKFFEKIFGRKGKKDMKALPEGSSENKNAGSDNRSSDFLKSIKVSPEQINSRKSRNASRDAKEYGNNGRNKDNGQDI